jgi:hypothetical protein
MKGRGHCHSPFSVLSRWQTPMEPSGMYPHRADHVAYMREGVAPSRMAVLGAWSNAAPRFGAGVVTCPWAVDGGSRPGYQGFPPARRAVGVCCASVAYNRDVCHRAWRVCGVWRERVCPPRRGVPDSPPLSPPPRLRELPREPRQERASRGRHGDFWPSAGARAPAGASFGKLPQNGLESRAKKSFHK